MKLIEPTHKTTKQNRLQGYFSRVSQLLPAGKPSTQGEETVLARFQRGLDNRFIMLRNHQLEKLGPPFPPILVGPAGLAVLNISQEKGFFKAKDDSWWRMNKNSHRFDPARPNLIKQSQEYAKKLAMLLDVRGKVHPEVTPILIFANPGVNIETINPAIRIVLMDGIDSLISTFLKSEEVLRPIQINYLAETLEVMANPEKAIPKGEGEDFFGQDLILPDKKTPPKPPAIPVPTEIPIPPVEEKLQLSSKQWIILGVLLIITIVVLLVAILFALNII